MELPEFDNYPYPGDVLEIGSYIDLCCSVAQQDVLFARDTLLEQIEASSVLWRMLSMPKWWYEAADGDSVFPATPRLSYKYYANRKMDTGEGINWHVGLTFDMASLHRHLEGFMRWGVLRW